MSAPPITERHLHHFHRRSPIKELVRAATTANITIATALNNGDSLDGVTLATGDRVLVKDQSTGSQNGIWVVGATPFQDYDLSTDDPGYGFLVLVLQGTVNAGTLWQNTNTSAPTIDTTSITFAAFSTGSTPSGSITASGYDMSTARMLGRTTASTGAIEEISVGTGLTLSAGTLTANVGGGGGGSGFAHSFVGYNTIGGTWTTTTAFRHYCKQFTLASAALLVGVDAYVRPSTDNVVGMVASILTDNAGSPEVLLGYGGSPTGAVYLSNSASMPGAGRWVTQPIGIYLPAGTYWMVWGVSAGLIDIANDGSGSDQHFTTTGQVYATGTYVSAWPLTTTALKYSLRASILS